MSYLVRVVIAPFLLTVVGTGTFRNCELDSESVTCGKVWQVSASEQDSGIRPPVVFRSRPPCCAQSENWNPRLHETKLRTIQHSLNWRGNCIVTFDCRVRYFSKRESYLWRNLKIIAKKFKQHGDNLLTVIRVQHSLNKHCNERQVNLF